MTSSDKPDPIRAEDIENFANKVESSSIGGKIRTVFLWVFRILGLIFLLISTLLFVNGHAVGGLVCAAITLFFLLRGANSALLRRLSTSFAFLLFGILFAWLGYSQMHSARASASWPEVSGTIERSWIKEQKSTTGTGSDKRTTTTHIAHVEYTYEVEGSQLTGTRISFNPPSEGAGEIAARYPEGKQVAVHYDPDNYTECVLEPGVAKTSYLFLALGCAVALMGLFTFIRGLKPV